jgi:uncharacterized coiled-coil DUF342 family protein
MKWFGSSKKKEVDEYEKKYDVKLKERSKTTPKEKKTIETKTQIIDNKTKNIESISKKLELVKEEYNEVVGNLMNAKREQKNIIQKIHESNNEYEKMVSQLKSLRTDLLKINNELSEKNEKLSKITEEYKKHSLVMQEINNSKKEVLELKMEIKKYNNELESVKSKTGNFPEINKMREEKKKLENQIIQKRKDVESGTRELKFIQNQLTGVSKNKESKNVVDAASAVVASMKQKLQHTQKELDLARKALEEEKKAK